jgi:hypothetical protein
MLTVSSLVPSGTDCDGTQCFPKLILLIGDVVFFTKDKKSLLTNSRGVSISK